MIIVTGSDNSGKTTLVSHLGEKFSIPIAERFKPLPPRNPSDWDKWYRWVLDNFERKDEMLYDRFFIDELVFGPVLRGGFNLTHAQMAELSGALIMKQPLYIYTCPPHDTILRTYDEREQYVDKDFIFRVLNQFNRVNRGWPVNQLRNKLRFDYTIDPEKKVIDNSVSKYLHWGEI